MSETTDETALRVFQVFELIGFTDIVFTELLKGLTSQKYAISRNLTPRHCNPQKGCLLWLEFRLAPHAAVTYGDCYRCCKIVRSTANKLWTDSQHRAIDKLFVWRLDKCAIFKYLHSTKQYKIMNMRKWFKATIQCTNSIRSKCGSWIH